MGRTQCKWAHERFTVGSSDGNGGRVGTACQAHATVQPPVAIPTIAKMYIETKQSDKEAVGKREQHSRRPT